MSAATILAVSGSPRRGGNSDILMERILAGALSEGEAAGVTGEAVYLRRLNYRPCIACEKCREAKACVGLDDDMQSLYPKIEAAKGLILVSPTHFYTVSAMMKAFIDRLYCYFDFDEPRPGPWKSRLAGMNKSAVIAAICEQDDPRDMGCTLDVMRQSLDALGVRVAGQMAVYSTFDKGKVAGNNRALADADKLGRRLAKALAKTGGG